MNPNLCRVALRPRDPLEVFDLAFLFLRARSGVFFRLSLVILGPVFVVGCLVGYLTDWHWGVGVGVAVVGFGLEGPFVLLAGRLLFDDRVAARTILGEVVRGPGAAASWLAVYGAALLAGAATCGVALPLFLGGVAFVHPVLLLERLSGARALRRSTRLSGIGLVQAAAAVLGSLFLAFWMAAVAEAAGVGVIDLLFQFGRPFGSATDGRATPFVLLGLLMAVPLTGVYRLLLYVDARTRVEGWDLQVDLRALGLTQ